MHELPIIPGYHLHKRLGAGGMGVVYLATRDDNDYHYAVKMLLVGRDAVIEDLVRFRIEAEAYACLNHPFIINIRDVGVVAGCPFLAMDFAANGSLDAYLKRSPQLDLSWRMETIKRVAEALSHAHGRRILHRDLKPANILVAADGSPRVTDFGLVKFAAPLEQVNAACCTLSVARLDQHLMTLAAENRCLLPIDRKWHDTETVIQRLSTRCSERSGLPAASIDTQVVRKFIERSVATRKFKGELAGLLDNVTHAGTVLGSPHYMAPEQAEGRVDRIGPHTDVYGLGATLYQITTGRPPIIGDGVIEVLRNISLMEPVSPTEIDAAISEDLSLVILKSLEKLPENRYPTMQMFGDDLDRILNGRKPLARLSARVKPRGKNDPSMWQLLRSYVTTVWNRR